MIPQLVTELAGLGVKLRLVGEDQLEVTAPSGRLSEVLRGRIVAHKPELVAWLAGERGGRDGVPPLAPDPARWYEPFPPSDLQTSFLVGSREGFEHHVRPHQYLEFDLDELDPARFEAALNRALHRQRANLVVVGDDMRLAAVRDPVPVEVRVTDLRGQPPSAVEEGIARVRAAMRRRELPLDRWPWLDVEISRYGDSRGRLHYNNNNFFSDAWGTLRFLDSVLDAYHHPQRTLPELEVSYRDCVLALAALEESPRGRAAARYWTDRMAGWPGPPELPLASGVDTRRRSRLSRREILVPADRWAAAKAAAGARGLTATSTATAAYAELLAYWSGSRHFLLSNMVTHRSPVHPQVAEVIGNFAALYPLEVDWRPVEPFAARARRLQAQVVADLEHTAWSGAKVLQTLNQVRRTPGRMACPYAAGSALFAGPVDRPVHSLLETPQVVLDCEFWQLRGGELWVVWDVIEEVFPPGLVDAMQAGFRSLLDRLGEGDRAWDDPAPDLLPAGQRAQRTALNRSGQPPSGGLLHAPLPVRAAQAPDRPAVVAPDATVSYRDLHWRAAELSALLRDRGVRPGDLVAVLLPKGWRQVVAVLGTLGAGAAYVPIDPGWPAERIRFLLEDTGARAVLADRPPPGLPGVAVIALDLAPPVSPPSTMEPAPRRPEDLAYVIYTSGSTGRPKGAMLDHLGPVNTIADVNRRFGVGGTDVVFGVSSLCFDLSVYDVFGTIAAGATLVLPGGDDPAGWLDLVRRHRVTVWNSVPALMQLLVEEAEGAGVRLADLRTVLLSGDWVPVELPDRIRAVAPHATVVSLGGATEASIWSICYPVDRTEPGWVSVPYGRPLANQSWHVLDCAGRDAPVWTAGELHIGGTGVALGYLGDPQRTGAAFVAHPGTGERLYRTGDLGRYLPSGDIEFLGRADFQVKIQGFRVEPGEIEHTLAGHPDVRQAAVVARDTGSGRQLAAFVAGARPDPRSLSEFLSARLPAHLVPSTISVLDELPRTPNGKIDRRALQAAPPADQPARRPHVAPRTATEAVLAQIWGEVLGGDPVGVHDDFFERGGQSFAALRVAGLAARRLGRRIPPGVLLEHRSVAELAGWLASPGTWSPLVWLREPGERGEPWFFVHPAGGGVLCYRRLAELLDQPLAAFQAPGAEAGKEPLDSIGEFAGSYLPALLAARPHGPYRLAGWSSGAAIAFELAHRLERRGERVERLMVIDAPAPAGPRPVGEAELLRWFEADVAAAGPLDGADRDAALAVFRGVVRACHDYRPPTIGAGITVLRAAAGSVGEFAGHPCADAADWGWAGLTTGAVTTATLPGTHYTVLTDPHVTAVAAAVRRWTAPAASSQNDQEDTRWRGTCSSS
jgi:pyochelin synthetase